jgi:hypothetical protein
MPDALVKQTAEGSETLESHFKADISDPDIFGAQQFLRFFNPPFNQVLMRRLVERLPKESEKVIPGKTGLARNLIQI